jgi:multiple antibiotic resistance protein
MSTLAAAFLLFLILDPIGNVPVFLSILRAVPPERRRRVMLRELIFALIVLVVFLAAGQIVLDFLRLEQEAVSIAGGIILFIIALRMIFPVRRAMMADELDGEPFLVPLAVPLIAGPSTIATLLLLVRSAPDRLLDWLAALLLAWFGTLLILLSSSYFYRFLGPRGLTALERLMGMLLVVMAVQMFLNGLRDFLVDGIIQP